MIQVKVTVMIGNRSVPVEEVSNPRVASALKTAGRDLGAKLDAVSCPEHGKGPSNVRMHFGRNGAADLNYDSCCEKLGKLIGEKLG